MMEIKYTCVVKVRVIGSIHRPMLSITTLISPGRLFRNLASPTDHLFSVENSKEFAITTLRNCITMTIIFPLEMLIFTAFVNNILF